ncbi:MAG: NUDIX hydrolase [Planctomycetota bacterium]
MTRPCDKPVAESIGWDPTARQLLFDSKWFRLHRDTLRVPPGGQSIDYHYVIHPGSVVVAPITSAGEVILIESYRYPIDRWCWELPAGRLEPSVPPEVVARTELQEEIGATCRDLEHLTTLQIANGFADCPTHFFLATGIMLENESDREPGEHIRSIEALSIDDALARLTAESQDGDSALGLLLATRAMKAATT